ncbi:MAG: succinylglutamate desuccinylase/aspartoacylase family protein [Cyclobacteriaceae bacterium]
MERILGKLEGKQPGPLIICLAAVHGNEPLGLHAFQNVYSALVKNKIPFKGKLIGLAGNIKAIRSGRRYLDYDLNRCWTEDFVQAVIEGRKNAQAEDEELRSIHQIISEEANGHHNLKVMVDLHGTSAEKGNFIVVPEELNGHPIITSLRIPIIVDLHKYLNGTLLSYYSDRGYVAFAFEGGLIGSSEAYRLHTSGLWEILETAGCVTGHDHHQQDHYSSHLAEMSANLPAKVKVLYRHLVKPEDGFRMYPGFHNFQPVHKNQELAIDAQGVIKSPHDGLIFMPLYQPEGDDGFFIVEEA